MTDRMSLTVSLWMTLALLAAPESLAAQDTSPELMLFEEIPIVVTATRTARSVRDVPSAVTVITSEDIKASGATTITELLETVPGLDVMRISKSDFQAASRGFVAPSTTSLLTMVDGRSVYTDFFGITTWESINVTLQDIERIEVVRGPGSALYGANAFAQTCSVWLMIVARQNIEFATVGRANEKASNSVLRPNGQPSSVGAPAPPGTTLPKRPIWLELKSS